MKWQGGRKSDNFEDRRGMSGGQKLTLGGVGGIIVLIIGFLMGEIQRNYYNRRKI